MKANNKVDLIGRQADRETGEIYLVYLRKKM